VEVLKATDLYLLLTLLYSLFRPVPPISICAPVDLLKLESKPLTIRSGHMNCTRHTHIVKTNWVSDRVTCMSGIQQQHSPVSVNPQLLIPPPMYYNKCNVSVPFTQISHHRVKSSPAFSSSDIQVPFLRAFSKRPYLHQRQISFTSAPHTSN
jgi:hypothetical protein